MALETREKHLHANGTQATQVPRRFPLALSRRVHVLGNYLLVRKGTDDDLKFNVQLERERPWDRNLVI
jgi:hypothetical protein